MHSPTGRLARPADHTANLSAVVAAWAALPARDAARSGGVVRVGCRAAGHGYGGAKFARLG
ncbi:hypothetical protein [Mycobacterium sp. E1386]|uniref:hypothetical protein n=1 Tax=Mycobacterium sp. E1386 TaxID=1834126 RepID=UPI000ABC1653|nr:hypothetical protein [Mycobacterium sp. E1386]